MTPKGTEGAVGVVVVELLLVARLQVPLGVPQQSLVQLVLVLKERNFINTKSTQTITNQWLLLYRKREFHEH